MLLSVFIGALSLRVKLSCATTNSYLSPPFSTTEGTYSEWTRGPIALIVYKKNTGKQYVIEKIKLQTGSNGFEATIPATGTAWIRIDKNGNEILWEFKDGNHSSGSISVKNKEKEKIVKEY